MRWELSDGSAVHRRGQPPRSTAMPCAVAVMRTKCDRCSVEHSPTIAQIGEGAVQAICSCGWRSEVFGADETLGTMDPLQQAREAADLHGWDSDFS
ncbi:MAG TPA: hypothetical protein VFE65_37530 [Pseudonocardia sp.]|jgi:hypothetical protein|nr:hypothetical protein [Pseudonocardia sp.]